MAKKKTSKKVAAKSSPEIAPEPTPEVAIVNEQIITVRGTGMGGVKAFTRSEYDKEFSKE